jgi:hypothetical protein
VNAQNIAVKKLMGRWDNGGGTFGGDERWRDKKRRNYVRIAKFVIISGFVVVAAVVLTVFLTNLGVKIEISERNEMGAIQTLNMRISNNNFESLNDVTVQFGDKGRIQKLGKMEPFSSLAVTPDQQELNFDKVVVRGSNTHGNLEVIKFRK